MRAHARLCFSGSEAQQGPRMIASAPHRHIGTIQQQGAHDSRQEEQIKNNESESGIGVQYQNPLVATADAAEPAVSVGYRHDIDDLKLKFQVIQTKIETLKAVGEKKWDTLKEDIELSWRDLHKTFKGLGSPVEE
ncbi:MAG: hypothetical protein R3B07_25675 [Polyangiaceae bacterium]